MNFENLGNFSIPATLPATTTQSATLEGRETTPAAPTQAVQAAPTRNNLLARLVRRGYDNSSRPWDFAAGWNNEPNYTVNNWTPDRVAQRIQGLWESMNARHRAGRRLKDCPLEEREANARNDQRRRTLDSRRNRVMRVRRRTAYARHRIDATVQSIMRYYSQADVPRLFTAAMTSDDQGEGGVVHVPHYCTAPVQQLFQQLDFLTEGPDAPRWAGRTRVPDNSRTLTTVLTR
ncbi:hypothetical protein O0I10_013054 [Lichtheimia ornata]|uniref:Uncharacterized protein n=1 Tax=Lichtheimia ornata TaxID=688661 RepID=A0AAD7UQY9_9FUNG|nr:uncharacterized protein O0I10_013054 [Lichtheimia ornata]KAJ8651406.1 hypothetical protein O0I10_013054 [Lichtheimia ornata]